MLYGGGLKEMFSYLISAPAMKHPGFEEMSTALLTSLLAHTSCITSPISFCIWMDSVLTCREEKMTIRSTLHLHSYD